MRCLVRELTSPGDFTCIKFRLSKFDKKKKKKGRKIRFRVNFKKGLSTLSEVLSDNQDSRYDVGKRLKLSNDRKTRPKLNPLSAVSLGRVSDS